MIKKVQKEKIEKDVKKIKSHVEKHVKKEVKKADKRYVIFMRSLKIGPPLIILGFILFIVIMIPEMSVYGETTVLGAHRGNSVDYIENTIPAFQSALIEEKYKFIEFDVQYTKDKQMIIYHDTGLERLHERPEKIQDLTYEELLNISYFHIPLYSEVMDLIAGEKPLNIEVKSQGNFSDDKIITDFIINDIKKREIFESTLFSSVSIDVAKYAEEKEPTLKTGKIYYITTSTFLHLDLFTAKLFEQLEETNVDYLMLHGSNLRNYESLKELIPEGKTLAIWYFTDEMYLVNPQDYFARDLNTLKLRIFNFFKKKDCIWWC